MPPARKKQATSTLKVFVLENAEDMSLKEALLSNNLEDPWVSWGKHTRVRCFLQCTVHGNTINNHDDINIWQISHFDAHTTPINEVVDLQLCRDLTTYPVIFQPIQPECTAAKIGKIIKAVCRSTSSSGLAEASTVASIAVAQQSSVSAASISIPRKKKSKTKRRKNFTDDDEDDDQEKEDEQEDQEEKQDGQDDEDDDNHEEEQDDEDDDEYDEDDDEDDDDDEYSNDSFIASDSEETEAVEEDEVKEDDEEEGEEGEEEEDNDQDEDDEELITARKRKINT